jgi:hypothetical protein
MMDGLITTDTGVGGGGVGVGVGEGGAVVVIVSVATSDLLESAWLVAVTVNVPAVLGAVYIPEGEMVPPFAVQVTAVLFVFLTDAVNCCCAFTCSAALCGLTVTDNVPGGGGVFTLEPVAQPTVVATCNESSTKKESRQIS